MERFEVVGSTVFTEEELQAALAPYVGRPLTFAELLQARTTITQLYVEAGYLTSGAFIPPQTPINGVLKIQVIEGSVVEIQVEGTTRLNPTYVSSRLGLAAQSPPQVDLLVEALRLLQLDPVIENISAEVSEAIEPGTTRLVVQVEEADTFDVDLVTNNNRNITVGTWERGFYVNERNLTGLGDRIRVGYLNTEGSNRGVLDYTLPVSPRNSTVSVSFEYTESEVIEEPADVLDIDTESLRLDLTVRHPLFQTPTEELALSLTGSWNENRSNFLGNVLDEPIPFPGFGANDEGVTETYTVRFAQEWLKRGSADVIAARSQFNLGVGGTEPAADDAPDSNFFYWLAQAQWARLLGSDILLLVRGEAQLATDSLPTTELYGLGGQQTVRGYRQDRLLTDNALFATAEVRFPVLRDAERDGMLQVVPFFDVGTGWNTSLPHPEDSTLVGTGLGLLWTEKDIWTARLDWGIPLVGEQSGTTWQESGIYFSLNLQLF